MKKKLFSILLSLAMVVTMMPAMTMTAYAETPAYAASGTGEENNPYIINTLSQLEKLADAVNGAGDYSGSAIRTEGKYFKLSANIGDATTGVTFEKVIGSTDSNSFKGNFDGNGHTITVNIDKKGQYIGLFGSLGGDEYSDASISNLTVAGSVKGTYDTGEYYDTGHIGGIVGYCNGGTLTNCCNCAVVKGEASAAGNIAVGGLAGLSRREKRIINCCNKNAVSGETQQSSSYVGGLVGKMEYHSSVMNSYNIGDVTNAGTSSSSRDIRAGGVVGKLNTYSKIENCYNSGAVTATTCNESNPVIRGGVVGYGLIDWEWYHENGDDNMVYANNCYFDNVVNAGLKVLGDGLADTTNSYGLTTAQMKMPEGGTYSGEGIQLDGKALVDLLNDYRESDVYPKGWEMWEVKPDAYPIFKVLYWSTIADIFSGEGDYTSETEIKDDSENPLFKVKDVDGVRTITLLSDITAGESDSALTVPSGNKVVLDLNGHTIDRGLSGKTAVDNGCVITISGELTLNDNSKMKTGIITGGNNTAAGGGVAVNSIPTVGIIGCFTMNGGTIRDNKALKSNGGGVSVAAGSSFTMTGGTITNNSSAFGGGASVVGNKVGNNMYKGVFIMTGGTITNNSSINQGGGIYNNKGTLILGGNAVVKNNLNEGGSYHDCDVQNDNTNYEQCTIKISSATPPTTGMSVGLYGSKDNQCNKVTEASTGQEKYFFSNNPDKYVKFNSETSSIEQAFTSGNGFKITVNSNVGGVVYPSAQCANNGTEITLDVVANNGYQLKSLKYNDGQEHDITSAKSFTMPNTKVTVTAEFDPTEPTTYYTITNAAPYASGDANHGYIEVSGNATEAASGDAVNITVHANPGWELSGNPQVTTVSDDAVEVSGDATTGIYSFTMPGEDVTVTATFKAKETPTPTPAPTPTEPTIVVPVSGGEEKVEVSATVSGEKATVGDISEKDIEKVVSGDKGDAVVEIDLSGLDKTISEVELPVKTVEKIAEATQASGKEEAGMSVKMSAASVTFDAKATQAMVDQAEGNTIQLVVDDIKTVSLNAVQKEAVEKLDTAIIIDAYLVSNGIKLCTESKNGFAGGKATVALQYEIKNNRTPLNYKVFYVDDNGKLTNLKAKYNEETKSFVFDIEHFSNYAVAYDENGELQASKVNLTKTTTYKNGKIKLTFKGLKLSDGKKITSYQIYRSTSKKFNKNLKKYSIKRTANTKSYTWTNSKKLKKGTKYYYKVRGKVKLSDGTYAYTKWSNVKHIKCKKTRK